MKREGGKSGSDIDRSIGKNGLYKTNAGLYEVAGFRIQSKCFVLNH